MSIIVLVFIILDNSGIYLAYNSHSGVIIALRFYSAFIILLILLPIFHQAIIIPLSIVNGEVILNHVISSFGV